MQMMKINALLFFLAASCVSSNGYAAFSSVAGTQVDGSVCDEAFYPERLDRVQATGKIVYLFTLNKAGAVEDIAVLNPVNHPVVEEAALAWKKSCKYPADPVAAGAGWQRNGFIWSDETYSIGERYVLAYLDFKRQAARGNAGAMFRVAEMTERGQGTRKGWDLDAAKPWYFKAAEAGDARAQAWLSRAYMSGIELPEDQNEGLRWLRLAAGKGNAGARNELARWYERSDNPERDLAQARSLYRLTYESGDYDGRIALARMLLDAPAQERDPVRAAALYQAAAEDDDPRGMSGLAALYADGVGLPADPVLAEKWLSAALKARDPHARTMRGDQLMSSASSEAQSSEACDWYRQAAELGYAPAQSKLAHCFATGVGRPQDMQRAGLWYELALKQNDAEAVAAMKAMAARGAPLNTAR